MDPLIETTVFSYCDEYIRPHQPLVLGLSGGPDSTCLLYLLLKWRACRQNEVPLHLAHVDHAWRSESAKEAALLGEQAAALGLPFHLLRLDPARLVGNLEAASRTARLDYFAKVCLEVGAQGVALAHHADDQCETVFQRLLEGASFAAVGGIRSLVQMETLTLFRPMLALFKEAILDYLKAGGITYFEDPTNLDSSFLRGRLRSAIFPHLRKYFGKEFEENLLHIAREAQTLEGYLERKLGHHLALVKRSCWGVYVDASNWPDDDVERKFLLRQLCKRYRFSMGRYQIDLAHTLLGFRTGNKQIDLARDSGPLFVDRGRLFFLRRHLQRVPDEALTIREGYFSYGEWRVRVEVVPGSAACPRKNSWHDAWMGDLHMWVPIGTYALKKSDGLWRRRYGIKTRSLRRLFSDAKIPRWLAEYVPCLVNGTLVEEDFLLGLKQGVSYEEGHHFHIALTRDFKDYPELLECH